MHVQRGQFVYGYRVGGLISQETRIGSNYDIHDQTWINQTIDTLATIQPYQHKCPMK